MGQKSNPNSFVIQNKKAILFGNSFYSGEYAASFKEYYSISSNLVFLFEKNKCFVKNCFIVQSNEKISTTFFIRFLIWKKRKKNLLFIKKETPLIQNFRSVLIRYGYLSSTRFIFQNLNKVSSFFQKKIFLKEHIHIMKKWSIYKKEPYFNTGLALFCLLNTTKNTSLLFAKFIAKFFKIFHRTRKINKFLHFLLTFVKNSSSNKIKKTRIKGLKIRIEGRFSGVPRSKTRIFEKGKIPLQTFKYNVVYAITHAHTSYGVFGVSVWLFD